MGDGDAVCTALRNRQPIQNKKDIALLFQTEPSLFNEAASLLACSLGVYQALSEAARNLCQALGYHLAH